MHFEALAQTPSIGHRSEDLTIYTVLFWPVGAYLVPSGLLLMAIGLIYLLLAVGFCSDSPFVALTRRELARC